MELRHLRYLVAVAEEENVGRAAKRLHISQPPLSRQIHAIEREIGTPLFARTPKGVELTEAGRVAVDDARNIISLVEQMATRACLVGQGMAGRIDISIFGSTVFGIVPAILESFALERPDVKVVLHSMERQEQLHSLRNRRIALAFNRFVQPEPGIAIEVVRQEPIMIALREDHPLARRASIPFTLLAPEPLILFPSGERMNFVDVVLDLFRTAGLKPNIAQEVGDAMSCLALIAGGLGLALVAESASTLSLAGVTYRPLDIDDPPVIDLSCLYLEDNNSQLLQHFLKTVRRIAQDFVARPGWMSSCSKGIKQPVI
ncbi:LysR family transcriptional regulator [Sphingobium sp.]|uniref:LysR family transcriptional regulator n=1 Tax=Sphingobium sp. TaxID=1912891 RepID=UPI0028BF3DC1|nr:LysR family transcriptional regulator [Sphingobium sp.]